MRRCNPEKRVKEDIKKVLKAAPQCRFFMPSASVYGSRGTPDFVGCSKGRFFCIEAKALDGELTKLQVIVLCGYRSAGGTTMIIQGSRAEAPDAYSALEAWLR